MFRFAYNTNGLAHHRLADALRLLSDLGYEGVAITPDVGQLDLYRLSPREVSEVRALSDDLGLELAIETGARYLMDARKKHRPTLLENEASERTRRVDFLKRSIDLATALRANIVSLWSGAAPAGEIGDASATATDCERIWDRLCEGLSQVLTHAREHSIRIAFEPEPGMFIERPSGYAELVRRLGAAGDDLGLCLDVGHLLVTRDLPVSRVIAELSPRLLHVHLDDIREGRHEHRMFGEGELDLAETLRALLQAGYAGLAAVELSRDSHRGAQAAEEALMRLREALHT